MTTITKALVMAIAAACFSVGFAAEDPVQKRLEYRLSCFVPDDDLSGLDDVPETPLRNRDALADYAGFMARTGWTTNQLVEGLMFAATNNSTPAKMSNETCQKIAGIAFWGLSKINLPQVTNFFRKCNEDFPEYRNLGTFSGMFFYTGLEPEVIAYMKSLCVMTNEFSEVSDVVLWDMLRVLRELPDELKPVATNGVASYAYYAMNNLVSKQHVYDDELILLVPSYSNSLQRLSSMQYIAATATNTYERSNAAAIVQQLSAIPTNQLNDVSWIAE